MLSIRLVKECKISWLIIFNTFTDSTLYLTIPVSYTHLSENVIPKVEPIAVPVSNTVPKADCEELKRKKKEAKEASRGQSCKKLCIPEHPTASVCDEFKRRAQKLKNAEEARKMYDSNCFDGGDNGHIEQSEEIGKGAERCWNLYKECRKKLL